jgi:bacterial/archaeal transporter family protein
MKKPKELNNFLNNIMWIFFSISGALFWSIANIIDKTVLTKWVKKPLIPIIVTGVIWLVLGLMTYFSKGFSHLSGFNIFLAILTGIFSILSYLFYFKAMQIQEASRIVPLTNLYQLFVLILATIFLGEVFTPLKYLGIIFLVAGAILISLKNFSKISLGKAFWWIILTAGFYAINAILIKYLLNSADFWTIFGYKSIGMFLGSIPIAFFYFPDLIKTVKQHGKKVIIAMSASELITALGILFSIIATSIGYVTLVNALFSIQPFFVLLFTVLLTIFFPSILKEEISKSTIFLKFSAIILMFIGIILIT